MFLPEAAFEAWKHTFSTELRSSGREAALARLVGRKCDQKQLEAMLWSVVTDVPSAAQLVPQRKARRRSIGQLASTVRIAADRAHGLWLFAFAADLSRIAATLKQVAAREKPSPRAVHDHPAIYLCGYVASCAGTPRFHDIAELLDAAFTAAGKDAPAWTDEEALRKRIAHVRRSAPEFWRTVTSRKS